MYIIEKQTTNISFDNNDTVTEYSEPIYKSYEEAVDGAIEWAMQDSNSMHDGYSLNAIPNKNFDVTLRDYDYTCRITYRALKLTRKIPGSH